jgi:hypothetical protein
VGRVWGRSRVGRVGRPRWQARERSAREVREAGGGSRSRNKKMSSSRLPLLQAAAVAGVAAAAKEEEEEEEAAAGGGAREMAEVAQRVQGFCQRVCPCWRVCA